MYNILTELKKNREIWAFFSKQVERASGHWNGVLKNAYSLWAWRKKELVSKVNQRQKLSPIHIEINQVSNPRF